MFPALSDKTLALSEKVAHATMGIDALYRQETGAESDREGLVVVQMAEVSPTPFASYGEAQEYLADLAQQALALPEPDRRLYYTQACTSLWSFCAWRQGKLERMSDQISLFLHADPAPATSAQLDGYYRQLRSLLTEMGYTGDIKAPNRRLGSEKPGACGRGAGYHERHDGPGPGNVRPHPPSARE